MSQQSKILVLNLAGIFIPEKTANINSIIPSTSSTNQYYAASIYVANFDLTS